MDIPREVKSRSREGSRSPSCPYCWPQHSKKTWCS